MYWVVIWYLHVLFTNEDTMCELCTADEIAYLCLCMYKYSGFVLGGEQYTVAEQPTLDTLPCCGGCFIAEQLSILTSPCFLF